MNLSDIRKNLSAMDADERAEAVALLEALGIKGADKVPSKRKSISTKLVGHYERLDIICRTCGFIETRFYCFTPEVEESNHFLRANRITEEQFGANPDLVVKERSSGVQTCKHCHTRLSKLTTNQLVIMVLKLRQIGGENA